MLAQRAPDAYAVPYSLRLVRGSGRRLQSENPVIFYLELHLYFKSLQEVAAIATGAGLFLLVFGLLARAEPSQYRAESAPETPPVTD